MSKYSFGRKHWRNPDSKYGFNPEQFEIDMQSNLKRYNKKKKQVNELILETIESDPLRQEETFSMIVEVLREWKETK